MNVQELINKLSEIDQSKEVVIITPDGYLIVTDINICSWSGALVLSCNN